MAYVPDERPGSLLWTVRLVSPSEHHPDSSIAVTVEWEKKGLTSSDRFNVLHPEKLPSAIERYTNEVRRVLDVLEGCLAGKQWLVGDKCTFADLSFVTWNDRMDMVMGVPDSKPLEKYPNVEAWHNRMTSRDSLKTAMKIREKMMDDQGLMPNGMPKDINNMAEYEAKMKAEGDA